jgi:hypothetical protein
MMVSMALHVSQEAAATKTPTAMTPMAWAVNVASGFVKGP